MRVRPDLGAHTTPQSLCCGLVSGNVKLPGQGVAPRFPGDAAQAIQCTGPPVQMKMMHWGWEAGLKEGLGRGPEEERVHTVTARQGERCEVESPCLIVRGARIPVHAGAIERTRQEEIGGHALEECSLDGNDRRVQGVLLLASAVHLWEAETPEAGTDVGVILRV